MKVLQKGTMKSGKKTIKFSFKKWNRAFSSKAEQAQLELLVRLRTHLRVCNTFNTKTCHTLKFS